MISTIHEKIEDGRYTLEAMLTITDDGIMLLLCGGDKPHIGTVVMSCSRPSIKGREAISCTTSVINRLSHKDDIILVPLAEAICKKADTVVVASGGVHIDGAEESDIKRLMNNMEILTKEILLKLQ